MRIVLNPKRLWAHLRESGTPLRLAFGAAAGLLYGLAFFNGWAIAAHMFGAVTLILVVVTKEEDRSGRFRWEWTSIHRQAIIGLSAGAFIGLGLTAVAEQFMPYSLFAVILAIVAAATPGAVRLYRYAPDDGIEDAELVTTVTWGERSTSADSIGVPPRPKGFWETYVQGPLRHATASRRRRRQPRPAPRPDVILELSPRDRPQAD